MEVGADVDAMQQRALLAECFLLEGLGRRGEQDSCVVTKDSSQNLVAGSVYGDGIDRGCGGR